MSKEEGLWVAAWTPPDAFFCLGEYWLCWNSSYVCCSAPLHPPPDPGILAEKLMPGKPQMCCCVSGSSLFLAVTLESPQPLGHSWLLASPTQAQGICSLACFAQGFAVLPV